MKSSEDFFSINLTWLKVGMKTSFFFFWNFSLGFEVLPAIFSLQRENGCFESLLLSSNGVFSLLRAVLVHFKSWAYSLPHPVFRLWSTCGGSQVSWSHFGISMALEGFQSLSVAIILFDLYGHPRDSRTRSCSHFTDEKLGVQREIFLKVIVFPKLEDPTSV